MLTVDMFDEDLQQIISETGMIDDWEWNQTNDFAKALMIEGAAIAIKECMENYAMLPDSVCDAIESQVSDCTP